MTAPHVLADGLAYLESARWHDGRLWFAHWGTDEEAPAARAGWP